MRQKECRLTGIHLPLMEQLGFALIFVVLALTIIIPTQGKLFLVKR